jgi:glycerophosphoryl diester phosphodiesterase
MAGLNITQLVEQYHTAGLTIMGGYGDSRRDIEWLASRGFDGVFSNTVAVARATVDDIASR